MISTVSPPEKAIVCRVVVCIAGGSSQAWCSFAGRHLVGCGAIDVGRGAVVPVPCSMRSNGTRGCRGHVNWRRYGTTPLCHATRPPTHTHGKIMVRDGSGKPKNARWNAPQRGVRLSRPHRLAVRLSVLGTTDVLPIPGMRESTFLLYMYGHACGRLCTASLLPPSLPNCKRL